MAVILLILLATGATWLLTCLLAVPIWLLWSVLGVGAHFFTFLPNAWQAPSLPHAMALMLLFALIRTAATPVKFEFKA